MTTKLSLSAKMKKRSKLFMLNSDISGPETPKLIIKSKPIFGQIYPTRSPGKEPPQGTKYAGSNKEQTSIAKMTFTWNKSHLNYFQFQDGVSYRASNLHCVAMQFASFTLYLYFAKRSPSSSVSFLVKLLTERGNSPFNRHNLKSINFLSTSNKRSGNQRNGDV